MSSRPDLRLDWCSHAAAKYAVEHWHYSGRMPASKSVYLGVWERGQFVGSVVFSHGASDAIGKPYGLPQVNICELTRVALGRHLSPVSRVVSVAIRLLRRQSPGLRMVVSYADPAQSHHGGIYQAMGWLYVGTTTPDKKYVDRNGREWHSRNASETGWKKNFKRYTRAPKPSECTVIPIPAKHKYLLPLDEGMRHHVAPLAKPYPKRSCAESIVADASAFHAGEGGSTPTSALQGTA